jgi:hypothetical protein
MQLLPPLLLLQLPVALQQPVAGSCRVALQV